MLYTLVVYFILPITLILYLLRLWNAPDPPSDWRRVLLVTAHPDDECMFFGPTLVRLLGHEIASTGKIGERTVKLLCLSTGA